MNKSDIKMPFEAISDGGVMMAIVIRNNFHKDGLSFITDPSETIQFGYFSHPAGHKIQPHVHKTFERKTYNTQEVLYVKSGHVRVNFFSQDQIFLGKSVNLYKNDWIILMASGHSLDVLKDSCIIEIKNGPYAGDEDKIRFNHESI
jgi:mannose-6-phosphate isomerase-like protein (cupin superfamily)